MACTSAAAAAYQLHLDPDFARKAVEQGGTLLLLGVPEGTFLGLDHQAFTVGPKFKGVKMLPPGPHFVSYHASSKHGGYAALTGFFFDVAPRSILVKHWDNATETIKQFDDPDEEARMQAGVRNFDFDDGLAPYNLHRLNEWRSLSGYITQQMIVKLSPVDGNISVTLEASDPELMEPETPAEKALQQQLRAGREREQAQPVQPTAAAQHQDAVSNMDVDQPAGQGEAVPSTSGRESPSGSKAAHSGRCFYTHLPRLVKKSGATAAELTALNLDKTELLEQLIREEYGGKELLVLGELQFAFVAFVFGQSLDGLMQWKALLQLLLKCEAGPLHTHCQLFISLLQVLTHQLDLSLSPSENRSLQSKPLGVPMMDELLRDSFLWQLLSNFFQVLEEAGREVTAELFEEVQKLKLLLKAAMDWDFDMQLLADEDDEYAPVVVDT